MGLREIAYETILEKNRFMEKSVGLSQNREQFFKRMSDKDFWDKVESLYPSKYILKKLLVKTGLYAYVKRLIG